MKTLVLCNHKGGVSKTALATLLAHYFHSRCGLRVLTIDLDHQANFGMALQKSGRVAVAACSSDTLLTGTALAGALPAQRFVLVPAGQALLGLERQESLRSRFAQGFRDSLQCADPAFDLCIVDTNPNPDIRMISAVASSDFVLAPIQLNQEAMEGVSSLLNHERVGLRRIKAALNPKLQLVGLLPALVEATPFQKANFLQVAEKYMGLLIPIGDRPGHFASIPKRSCIAEAQASGELLWEMKKTAARDAWQEIEPSIACIARLMVPGIAASPPLARQPELQHGEASAG